MVRLMSRHTRTQVPILPRLRKLVVDHNVHKKLLTNNEHQASNYNMGAKLFSELKSKDMVCLILPLTNEDVKARVDKSMGTRS